MDVDAYVEVLEREGWALATTADSGGLDPVVPTCPDWQIRDLLTHVGYVHRWATAHVAQARVDRAPFGDANGDTAPGDDALVDWFRDGHAVLVATLRSADPALVCWTFLAAPSPLMFWARRQAHETAIHRADADAGSGRRARFDSVFACDGIDELVMGFAPSPRARVETERRRVLAIRSTDVDGAWLVGLGPDGVDSQRGTGPHDGQLAGPASDLYLLLWNRLALDDTDIEVTGDDQLPALWGSSLRV